MEAGERIVGMLSHQRGKGRHGAGIAGLELGEGRRILRGCRRGGGILAQRLIGAQRFAPPALLGEYYVNHAHNDWLELWLTGGIPAIVLMIGFLAWLVASIFRLWKNNGEPEGPVLDLVLAQAASVVVVLLLLHSIVDFPLRIAAVTVLFAIACAYMIAGIEMSARKKYP